MKQLEGSASTEVSATAEESFALVAAIERYPDWYPEAVRGVEVLDRRDDGQPSKARAQLQVAYGPMTRSFDLVMAVDLDHPHQVKLTRIPHGAPDRERFQVVWELASGRIELELRAHLSMPRLLPVSGIGESFAAGFVNAAARALERRQAGSI